MAQRGRKRGRPRGSDNGWEAWGGYMNAKVQKLQNQFTESKSDDFQQVSSIFNGISIFVNGYTNPTSDELKKLMCLHGGVYHHYYNRQLVTHIIASNLPNNKILKIGDKKVIKPHWITESVAAGKLLSYQDFLLCRDQPSIQSGLFKNHSTTPQSDTISEDSVAQANVNDGTNHAEDVNVTRTSTDSSAGVSPPAENDSLILGEIEKERKQSVPGVSPGKNNKAGDPKFISEFYNNSRLHHLSTWGTEWKRYVNELRSKTSGVLSGREKLRSSNYDPDQADFKSSGKQQRVIMHIDMDCFFVSVGLRNRKDLKDKPVAVTHSRGGGVTKHREGVDIEYERAHWRRRKDALSPKHVNTSGAGIDDDFHDDESHDDSKQSDAGQLQNKQQTNARKSSNETFHSMAEIASCSYAARKAGVKNGMFMGQAKKLCPNLITIPYDFEGYHQVSLQLYDTIASYTLDIEAVSCDEMLVDLTSLIADVGVHPLNFSQMLRDEIFSKTQCTASAGLGPNILLAKMATRVAKPNGQFYVSPEKVLSFMNDKLVKDLPGVGYSMTTKLQTLSVVTCGQLRDIPLANLQKEFGPKTGQMLHKYSLGQDDRPIKMEQERKSVSAEINYGIRFTKEEEGERFLEELGAEVESRLEKAGMKGKTITLKLKVRRKDAPKETAKFMGHGICDNVAKSVTLPTETNSGKVIGKECWSILKGLKIPAEDLRGIGIQVNHLKPVIVGQTKDKRTQSITDFTTKIQKNATADTTNVERTSPEKQLASAQKNTVTGNKERNIYPPLPSLPKLTSPPPIRRPVTRPRVVKETNNTKKQDDFVIPSQVDPEVLKELPDDIRREIENQMGQRCQPKGKTGPIDRPPPQGGSTVVVDVQPGCSHWTGNNQSTDIISQPTITGDDSAGTNDNNNSSSKRGTDLIPLPSPSQIDPSCLAALPPELQREIQAEYNKQKKNNKPRNALQLLRSPTKNSSPKKSPQKRKGKRLQFKVPYNNNRKQAVKGKAKTSESAQPSNDKTRKEENNIAIQEEQIVTRTSDPVLADPATDQPHICGLVSLVDVKKLIAEWVTSSSEPEEEDLFRFIDYLEQLITHKNLERVDAVLRSLHRQIKKLDDTSWTNGFHRIVDMTQQSIQHHYNSILKLPF